jgi:hypothetical protein
MTIPLNASSAKDWGTFWRWQLAKYCEYSDQKLRLLSYGFKM